MPAGDIEAHIQAIYGMEVSDTTLSRITGKLLPIAKKWQQPLFNSVCAVIFLLNGLLSNDLTMLRA